MHGKPARLGAARGVPTFLELRLSESRLGQRSGMTPEPVSLLLVHRAHDNLLPLSRASLGELVEDLLDRPAEVLVVLGA
jgi:hypothetical protein